MAGSWAQIALFPGWMRQMRQTRHRPGEGQFPCVRLGMEPGRTRAGLPPGQRSQASLSSLGSSWPPSFPRRSRTASPRGLGPPRSRAFPSSAPECNRLSPQASSAGRTAELRPRRWPANPRLAHDAGLRLSTHSRTVLSRQPTQFGPSRSGAGNVPSRMRRQSVVRDNAIVRVTSFARRIRSVTFPSRVCMKPAAMQ